MENCVFSLFTNTSTSCELISTDGVPAQSVSAQSVPAQSVPAKNKTKHGILIIELYLVTYFFNLNEPVIINNYIMFNDILNAISSCKELLYNRCIQRFQSVHLAHR